MIDLATFQIVRAPRRAEPEDDQHLQLQSDLIKAVGNLIKGDVAIDDPAVEDLVGTFRNTHGDPLGPVVNPDTDEQFAMVGIEALELWLARAEDSVGGTRLKTEVAKIKKAYTDLNRTTSWDDALEKYAEDLASWILVWLASYQPPLDFLARATRLALVVSLAQLDATKMGELEREDTWKRLNARIVTLPPMFVKAFPKARVELVREATVADLNVVRSEWRAYVPGEIAMIRNVMAGETYEAKHIQLGEQEVTVSTDKTTLTQDQLDTEKQDQSELSRDVQTQVQVAVQGNIQAMYEQTGTGNKFSLSAGVSAGVQVGHSERTASRVAHSAVSKAISNVETTTRESRVQRQLTRTTDKETHGLKGGADGVRGIYRWVERIDRYQVFTYPERLQLEFGLPEPAEYVRWRNKAALAASQISAPPAFTVALTDIQPGEDILALAKKYHATTLPVLPDEYLSVAISKADEPKKEMENPGNNQWSVPNILIGIEVAVPDGFAAEEVTYSGYAMPLRANWDREYTGPNKPGGQFLEAFHTIFANVFVGTSTRFFFKADTTTLADANSVQGMRAAYRWTQYGEATLQITEDDGSPVSVSIDPPATGKLTVSAEAQGAATLGVTAIVKCKRTQEAVDTWRNAVYDALFAAWNNWNNDYQSAQARKGLLGAMPVGESSPPKNLQTVRDELKRQVIAWLLNESPFQGRKALQAPNPPESWGPTDLDAARATAPTIQFMEQAFEWNNLSYMFYPYYWADPARWDELSNFQGVDPDFERFLKAGSARVVVPARPGMEKAVHHWLLYQEPFLGLPMPVPNHPMYVSIATEIHDMTMPPEDGIPGESWDALLGTTLVWLDTSEDMPVNPLAKLGKPPHAPKEPMVPLPVTP